MKKILFSFILLAVACVSCGVKQQSAIVVMDEIRKMDNIESTRVPVSLISSLTGLGDLTSAIPGVNMSVLKNVNTIDLLTITNRGARNKARNLLEQFNSDKTYEMMFQSRNGKSLGTSIYALPNGQGGYSSVLLINDDNSKISIVELKGNMTMDDFKFLNELK